MENPTQITEPVTKVEAKRSSNTLIIVVVVIILVICLCVSSIAAILLIILPALNPLSSVFVIPQIQVDQSEEERIQNQDNNESKDFEVNNNSEIFSDKLPEGFPQDIPVFNNSKVYYSYTFGEESVVTLEVDASPEEVNNFILEGLRGNQWNITSSGEFYTTYAIEATKDGRTVNIGILPGSEEYGTLYTITY